MSEEPEPGAVPEFDLADRMRKSLRHAGIPVADMADYLGVSRKSVGNWIGGRIDPDTRTIQAVLHQCRHRFLTLIYQDTHDIRLVQGMAGHTTSAATDGYTAYDNWQAFEAVERLPAPKRLRVVGE